MSQFSISWEAPGCPVFAEIVEGKTIHKQIICKYIICHMLINNSKKIRQRLEVEGGI